MKYQRKHLIFKSILSFACYVAGASSGIGIATSVLFSKLGAKLVLSGRNIGALENTATTCLENSLSDSKVFFIVLLIAVDHLPSTAFFTNTTCI